MPEQSQGAGRVMLLFIYATLILVIGLGLTAGGARLLMLGGSPYYALCGISLVASGLLLCMRRVEGALLYGVAFLATLAWALWEAGVDGWALAPRVVGPALLGAILLLPAIRCMLVGRAPNWPKWSIVGALFVAITIGAALHTFAPPHSRPDPLYQTGMGTARAAPPIAGSPESGDWLNYGNDPGGSRFSRLDQITPANVARLNRAWSYDLSAVGTRLEATPLKIDRTLYLCSGMNEVIALNAETGKELWRSDPHLAPNSAGTTLCRGVGYYRVPNATGKCSERIISNTQDARLIALDAHDGTSCSGFGANGEVSLLTGMGKVESGYYFVTSAPTIVQGKIVLGGWVADNQYWGEPSGVIRAYDAVTGQFAWAFDVGHLDRQTEPPEGETYTRSTPNSWGPMSADENLGLVYAPTGNATPDYFGGVRRSFDEQYGSSVVAIEAATGKLRWSFQTAHHDLWDYDVPAQPTLVDIPMANNVMVHALLQPTKRGELFVLDRATGAAIYAVEERAAPQSGAVPEEHLAPTQPFSVGMPSFRGADLTEGDMWGITPLDQLWCRIKFREARYDGPNTPPGLTPAIHTPGFLGGMEWGGVAVDTVRDIAIVSSNNFPIYTRLIPRAEIEKMGVSRIGPNNLKQHFRDTGMIEPQEGAPYGVSTGLFISPIGVPCRRPPYHRLSAVDITTGKLIWTQVPDTARNMGPLGLRSHLPFAMGAPTFGGALVIQSGIVFMGSPQDHLLRAYDIATGKVLWEAPLPGYGTATPMTYVSPDSGRQVVAIAVAGFDGQRNVGGNHVVAYALPKSVDNR
jgi:quinoprotein glucose dehydrogenase